MEKKYPHLFSPIMINKLRFRNRIMMSPMGDPDLQGLTDRAAGGASVMTLGSYQIDEEFSGLMGFPDPFSKKGADWMREQIIAMRAAGTYASVQLMHAGRYAHNLSIGDGEAIGPVEETYVHKKGLTIHVKAMDEAMMEHVSDNYAAAAAKYKKFGFDMVLLHFAHGWLPAQFLSPHFNTRTDEYGGSLENRAKFPLMILRKVREAVGPDFPVEMRICGKEYIENGLEIDECCRFAQMAEPYIDLIHVSAGLDSEFPAVIHMSALSLKPHFDKLEFAEAVKKCVSIPVVTVGSIDDPAEAEEVIASGKADLVAVARGFLADPEWAKKAAEDRAEDITPCIRCGRCNPGRTDEPLGCSVNPRYMRESRIPKKVPAAEKARNVLVVGGGPGGMKAAVTAAARGHNVTLCEKTGRLGGQIKNFEGDFYKQDLAALCRHLVAQVEKSNVNVRLNTEVTKSLVEAIAPDAMIVAIGAEPKPFLLKGMKSGNVIQSIDAYADPALIKGKNIVVLGGGATGIEMALHLGDNGYNVKVAVASGDYLTKEDGWFKASAQWLLESRPNVEILTCTRPTELNGNKLTAESNGESVVMDADTVIVAKGFDPLYNEALELCGAVYDSFMIGDCYKVRRIGPAIHEGYFRAMNI